MTSFLKKNLAVISVSAIMIVSTGGAYAHQTGYRHQHDNSSSVIAGAIVGAFIGITLGAIIAGSAQSQQQQKPYLVQPPAPENWNYLMDRPWRWDYYKSVTRLGKPIVQWNREAGQYIEYRYAVQGNLYQYCTTTDRGVACAW